MNHEGASHYSRSPWAWRSGLWLLRITGFQYAELSGLLRLRFLCCGVQTVILLFTGLPTLVFCDALGKTFQQDPAGQDSLSDCAGAGLDASRLRCSRSTPSGWRRRRRIATSTTESQSRLAVWVGVNGHCHYPAYLVACAIATPQEVRRVGRDSPEIPLVPHGRWLATASSRAPVTANTRRGLR